MTETKGKKTRLIELIDDVGATPALRRLHDRGRGTLTILAYHRVTPIARPGEPFDVELVSATPEAFDAQMRYLRENMQPVSLTRVAQQIAGGDPLPPDAVAVTFDDGFTDVYDHAFPVLRQYGIPATVFAITENVETGEPFWFERAAALMARLDPHSLRIDEIAEALPAGADLDTRTASLRQLHAALKTVPNARRKQLFTQWAQDFPLQLGHRGSEIGWPLTWDQIHEMAAANIEFGSHTVTLRTPL